MIYHTIQLASSYKSSISSPRAIRQALLCPKRFSCRFARLFSLRQAGEEHVTSLVRAAKQRLHTRQYVLCGAGLSSRGGRFPLSWYRWQARRFPSLRLILSSYSYPLIHPLSWWYSVKQAEEQQSLCLGDFHSRPQITHLFFIEGILQFS
jgi:hypothetical protein